MKQSDLNQIKDVFNEVLGEQFPKHFKEHFSVLFRENFNASFAQIWEHNLEPAFSDLDRRFSKMEADYVTKHYLDDKIADLRSEFIMTGKRIK